jgi:hypothetical protein
MTKVKLVVLAALCGIVFFGGRPVAAATDVPLLFDGACPQAPAATPAEAPEPTWLTSDGCYNLRHCTESSECWESCPEASSAACVNNVCDITVPGGGGTGGGGGGCPQQSHCSDPSDCVFFGGITGTCINNVCVC